MTPRWENSNRVIDHRPVSDVRRVLLPIDFERDGRDPTTVMRRSGCLYRASACGTQDAERHHRETRDGRLPESIDLKQT